MFNDQAGGNKTQLEMAWSDYHSALVSNKPLIEGTSTIMTINCLHQMDGSGYGPALPSLSLSFPTTPRGCTDARKQAIPVPRCIITTDAKVQASIRKLETQIREELGDRNLKLDAHQS